MTNFQKRCWMLNNILLKDSVFLVYSPYISSSWTLPLNSEYIYYLGLSSLNSMMRLPTTSSHGTHEQQPYYRNNINSIEPVQPNFTVLHTLKGTVRVMFKWTSMQRLQCLIDNIFDINVFNFATDFFSILNFPQKWLAHFYCSKTNV